MTKYIIGAVIIIIVIAGGIFLWKGKPTALSPFGTDQQQTQTQPATSSYSGANFSVVYPSDFSVNPSFQYTEVTGKPISGVSFTIPQAMATGTNLAADSYVSIETLPRAKICTGDIYLPENVKAVNEEDNGVGYSVASSTDLSAGNQYTEIVYAYPGSSPCTAVRYDIHSTDINNYPAGSVQPFDMAAVMSAFDSIRDSVVLAPATATQ